MVNILDVAKKAGVSKSTVSRVINDKGYVAQGTREKVERVIELLDYTPSSFAQNIRTRKTRTIALMIPDSLNTFYMEMFKAIEEVTLKNNYIPYNGEVQ
jgi:LacI family transcriptional regulator